jgi:hypothetical protein
MTDRSLRSLTDDRRRVQSGSSVWSLESAGGCEPVVRRPLSVVGYQASGNDGRFPSHAGLELRREFAEHDNYRRVVHCIERIKITLYEYLIMR